MAHNEWPERELVKAACTHGIKSTLLSAESSTSTIQTLHYFFQCFSNYYTSNMLGGLLR